MDAPSINRPKPALIEQGTLIANRYEILNCLGIGGMGAVYRVRDRKLEDELVALKLLYTQIFAQDDVLRRRLIREVILCRALTHPNIVRIHDIGEDANGIDYISMEYVAGESLEAKLKREGKLGVLELLSILMQVLRGMSHAHQRSIIHRDLKPPNILLDNRGEAKIVDFGLARSQEATDSLTKTGRTLGTPNYMAPEQFQTSNADGRSDIYAIGIIAYELLCGKPPFEGDTYFQLATKHIHEPLPAFSSITSAPQTLLDAIRKATAKNPADRFQRAEDFLKTIEQLAVDLNVFDLHETDCPPPSVWSPPRLSGRTSRWQLGKELPPTVVMYCIDKLRRSKRPFLYTGSAALGFTLTALLWYLLLPPAPEIAWRISPHRTIPAKVRSTPPEAAAFGPDGSNSKVKVNAESQEIVPEHNSVQTQEGRMPSTPAHPEKKQVIRPLIEFPPGRPPVIAAAKAASPHAKAAEIDLLAGEVEHFNGSLSPAEDDTGAIERTLSLDLIFKAEEVSGVATVSGMGSFRVEGKIFNDRSALELSLISPLLHIDLVARKTAAALRGTYEVLGQRKSGKWQADLQ